MSSIHHSVAGLRLLGDDLNPDEVSALLGATPTEARRKGDEIAGRHGRVRIAKTGLWLFDATRCEPENLEGQIFELLGKLTNNLDVWANLNSRYKTDLFCGIFMGSSNDGLTLSPSALLALGERGIELDLDIYDADCSPS